MLHFIDKIISYIAPHECLACGAEGLLLCSYCRPLLPDASLKCCMCGNICASYSICAKCKKRSNLQNVWIRTPYEEFAKKLVRQLKFERAYSAADTIAASLVDDFASLVSQRAHIVPVPTASSRVRQRGYDQAVLIAKAFAKKTGLPYSPILTRVGQHRQTGNDRARRVSQLEEVFVIKKHHPKNDPIILIDDVLTTGATIESAARALHKSGYKHVSAMTFAGA
jgi:ComF family protein